MKYEKYLKILEMNYVPVSELSESIFYLKEFAFTEPHGEIFEIPMKGNLEYIGENMYFRWVSAINTNKAQDKDYQLQNMREGERTGEDMNPLIGVPLKGLYRLFKNGLSPQIGATSDKPFQLNDRMISQMASANERWSLLGIIEKYIGEDARMITPILAIPNGNYKKIQEWQGKNTQIFYFQNWGFTGCWKLLNR